MIVANSLKKVMQQPAWNPCQTAKNINVVTWATFVLTFHLVTDQDLRDHFIAQELESLEDIDGDPVVGVDVERLDDVAKAHGCFKPKDDLQNTNEITTASCQ